MLSTATDYVDARGHPKAYLERIAEAGFSHVHWTQQWWTDHVYSDDEIQEIAGWLSDFGLEVNDLHASAGVKKAWLSPQEHERLAGVELVKNRIEMASRLSSDVIVMHIPREPEGPEENHLFWTRVQRSLDAVRPVALDRGVRIAIENLYPDNFGTLAKLLSRFDHDFLGICYDSGHGNMDICDDGLDHLARLKHRLIALHLNDNDGSSDQHNLLFSGQVDWPRLAGIIAHSSYSRCINMELTMHGSGINDEGLFLTKAFETGMAFAGLVETARTAQSL
jgi:sugar phosphate isomerase/epimerase